MVENECIPIFLSVDSNILQIIRLETERCIMGFMIDLISPTNTSEYLLCYKCVEEIQTNQANLHKLNINTVIATRAF